MSEEEIIKCAEFLGNRKDETTVKIDNDFYDERDIWKGLLDLYNKEKEKNKEIEYIKSCFDFALEQQLSNYISKDKLRKFIKEDSFEETYNFETISKKNLLKFLEDNV